MRPYWTIWDMKVAEGVGFEPTIPGGIPVFKTGAFVRSAIPPKVTFYCITDFSSVQWEVGAEFRAFEHHRFGLHPFALG